MNSFAASLLLTTGTLITSGQCKALESNFDYLLVDIIRWKEKRWLIPAIKSHMGRLMPDMNSGTIAAYVTNQFGA